MRQLLILFLAFILFTTSAEAQTDSLIVVKAKWEKRKITRGIHWKHFWFKNQLFSSSQNINIIEVKPRKKLFFDLGYEKQLLKPTSEFASTAQALTAINGTFFDVKNGGSVDFIKADGLVINNNRYEKNNQRAMHQKAAIILHNGKLSIAKWDGSPNWEQQLQGEDILLTGPLLIHDQKSELLDTTAFFKSRHPRTAIGINRKNHILLITIDGRNENAAGMSLPELSKVLQWLGAKEGINLDGGGSTTMWVSQEPGNGIVNYPSDNRKWEHIGERNVANVIMVKRRKR